MSLTWKKKLSRSDAQVPVPRGWPVPYLRLTNSGHTENTQIWFRNAFFVNLNWQPGMFGKHAVEKAALKATVALPGKAPTARVLTVTHNAGRGSTGKKTPNTWIHWDDVTRNELRAANYSGLLITLKRSSSGNYSITVS
jgi:hypothetical protein